MRISKAAFAQITAIAVGIFLSAADPSDAAMVLRRGNGAEPSTTDPVLISTAWEHEIIADVFLGLTTEDAEGNPIPGAAESWTVSPDGLVWTFKLRSNLVWSDGTPNTAADFVFGLRRLLDPKTAAKYASLAYVIKNATAINAGKMPPDQLGIRAIDNRTVEITVDAPTPFLPGLLSHPVTFPMPRHVLEKFGSDWIKPGTMIGNGPYTLETNSPHNFIKLVKNPRFYEASKVAIDEVFFYPIDDENVALTRFRARDIDANITKRGFPVAQTAWLKENMPGEGRLFPMLATDYFTTNARKPPFNDARVRKAVSMCIDRDTLSNKVASGQSQPAYAFVPPRVANYSNTAKLDFASWSMDRRVGEAKRLLGEAGYGPDHPLTIEHMYMTSVDARRSSVAMSAMLKNCGIVVRLVANEPKIHYANLMQGDFTMATAAWGADYNDAQNFLFLLDSTSLGFNYGGYANPQFDALMAQAQKELDLGKRAGILSRAEQIALDDGAIMPIAFPQSRVLVAPYVKGYVDNVADTHRTRWMRIEK